MALFAFSKRRAARRLREELENGQNVDVGEVQRLVEYLYDGYSDQSQVVKITARGREVDEPFRRMCSGLVKGLRCRGHDHMPYVLAKGPSLFVVCCCASLESQVRIALSESFDGLL